MAKPIIAQTAQESTEKEKAACCSGCGQRFRRRVLVEAHEEHVAFGYSIREGERYCQPCARHARVL